MHLAQLLQAICWKEWPLPLTRALDELHLTRRRLEFESFAWEARASQRLGLPDLSDILAPSLLHRMLSGPGLGSTLRSSLSLTEKHLKTAAMIAAEKILAGESPSGPEDETWTSLADFGSKSDQGRANSYHAPRLGGAIVLDYQSPWVRSEIAHSAVMTGPFVPYDHGERQVITAKLTSAMALIDQSAPAAGQMIRQCTKVIRLRRTDDQRLASEQLPSDLGSIGIANAHLETYGEILLAEALVHESLHNFLTMYERYIQYFAVYENDLNIRPVSPWSGRSLPHAVFPQAVMIYFSLVSFFALVWKRRHQLDGGQRHILEDRLLACAQGFRSGYPVSECLGGIGQTGRDVLDLMDFMQEQVIDLMEEWDVHRFT